MNHVSLAVKQSQEIPELCSDTDTFDVFGKKFMRKEHLAAREFGLFLATEFPIRKVTNEEKRNASFLEPKELPPFVGIYIIHLYLIGANERDFHQKSIHIGDIVDMSFATHSTDSIPGYGAYILTQRKLVLISTRTASESVRLMRAISNCKSEYEQIKQQNLIFSLYSSILFSQQSEAFKIDEFYNSVKKELVLGDETVKVSLANFKKYLGVLAKHKLKLSQISEFVKYYHSDYVKYIKDELAKKSLKCQFGVRESLVTYTKLLKTVAASDASEAEAVHSVQRSINNALIERIKRAIDQKVKAYFDPATKYTEYNKNIYATLFLLISNESSQFDSQSSLNLPLIEQSLEHFGRRVKENLFGSKEVTLIQLIHLLNSACLFNREFFDFIEAHFFKFDQRALEESSLLSSVLSAVVRDQLSLPFKELFNLFESRVIMFFGEIASFETADPVVLLSRPFHDQLLKVKKTINSSLWELIANNTLNALLKLYFLSTLALLCDGATDIHYEKRLERDKMAIAKFFQAFLKPENLEPQIEMFAHFSALLSETKAERLLQAVMKFNVFFGNSIQAETLSAIFEKNIHVSFETEKELIGIFSAKAQAKERSFREGRTSQNGSYLKPTALEGVHANNGGIGSGIGANESGQEANGNAPEMQKSVLTSKTGRQHLPQSARTVSNYLPYVSLNIFIKAKEIAFRAKAKSLAQRLKDRLNLSEESNHRESDSPDLSSRQSLVKIITVEAERFENWQIQHRLIVALSGTQLRQNDHFVFRRRAQSQQSRNSGRSTAIELQIDHRSEKRRRFKLRLGKFKRLLRKERSCSCFRRNLSDRVGLKSSKPEWLSKLSKKQTKHTKMLSPREFSCMDWKTSLKASSLSRSVIPFKLHQLTKPLTKCEKHSN